jgi:hypothetical protein
MQVFVRDAVESILSAYVEVGDLVALDDRFGERPERRGVRDALVGPMGVVEAFELAQGVQEVVLIPNQPTMAS